jgi:hypothetical protein
VRLSAVAVVVLVAALVLRRPRLVPLSLALLGACYALYLGVDDPPLDVAAAVFAAGLFLTAELAYWSLDEREGVRAETQEAFRRTAIVALLGAGALLVSAAVLALADVVRAQGVALDIAGAAAAAAALLIVVLAGRAENAD